VQKISATSRQKIADSIQRNQITFPVVLDEGLQTFRAYSVVAVPTTYVTDEKRKILYKLSGYPISGRTALKDYIVEHFEGKKAVVLSATVKQPTNKEVIPLHKMARLKLEQGQLNLARKYAEKACSLDSLFAGTFALLAEIGIELDSVQLAEDAIRQVLLLTPHSVDGLCLKGLLLAKKGNAREALDVLAPLARADSAATLTHCCFAYALGMNGALKESLDEFAIAEAKSGSDYRIPLLRAEVYEHHSKMKEAEADRKRAKKLRSQR
jgi:predicted Zn-dependent protease